MILPFHNFQIYLRDKAGLTDSEAGPQLEEDVKWGGPSFDYKEPMATFNPRITDFSFRISAGPTLRVFPFFPE
jgi:hypothetical protein